MSRLAHLNLPPTDDERWEYRREAEGLDICGPDCGETIPTFVLCPLGVSVEVNTDCANGHMSASCEGCPGRAP